MGCCPVRESSLIFQRGSVSDSLFLFVIHSVMQSYYEQAHIETDYELLRAIEVFYRKSDNTEQEFIDSCQVLIDSGMWLMDQNMGETCLFLLENGTLFLPEEDQISPDGEFMITGTPRKNIVN